MPIQTTPQAVASAAERFGAGEAIVDGETRLSFTELHEQVRMLAGFFAEQGIRAGDRIALCAPNTWHWVVAALGAQYAGGVLVPVNTRFTGPEMLDVVRRSQARALVIAGTFLDTDRLAALRSSAAEADVQLPETVLRIPVETEAGDRQDATEPGVREWRELPARPVDIPVTGDDLSDILFTSGTSGRSKGAMSAHRQAIGVAQAWGARTGLREGDRYLAINPFFHSFGYKAGILACLLYGACLVPQAVFEPGRTLDLVESEGITVLPGAPTVYQSLLDRPRRPSGNTLRLAVTGAATVPVPLIERMRTELGFRDVLTGYGLTEAVVATLCSPEDDIETVAHSAGRVTADFELRIAANGEICLRGPNVMLGYLDDPIATANAIDADGWLHTGDVGVLDENGNVRITDRLKDMYICGGFNVYPAEIEHELHGLSGVRDVAVIGVPDERLGQVGKAYLVTEEGSVLTEPEVIEFCRTRLANYKVPRAVEFTATLPRNAAGKVLKRVLRKEA
ncbi:FadD3 family acyl-CoA ligase [Sciscionella marina]|uniref:FadD3 family acyl-CoA ligase n=1 Tax=Sciscionella marina TaxID=508770 RepID=UPI00036A213F|nr:FadD3 family acyl-CoA ligase [Sciscionella marina]